MADLLTHVLVPYVLLTPLTWWLDLDRRWIPVAMGGGAIPDLGKVGILLDESLVEAVLGVPFSYGPISTVAGVVVISAAIAVWFESQRLLVYGWILFGAVASLILDGLRVYADGFANFWVYPIWWRPPTPSLYVSSDYRVTMLVTVAAIAIYAVDRMRS